MCCALILRILIWIYFVAVAALFFFYLFVFFYWLELNAYWKFVGRLVCHCWYCFCGWFGWCFYCCIFTLILFLFTMKMHIATDFNRIHSRNQRMCCYEINCALPYTIHAYGCVFVCLWMCLDICWYGMEVKLKDYTLSIFRLHVEWFFI